MNACGVNLNLATCFIRLIGLAGEGDPGVG
jgi:hypothetical protein